MIPLTYKCVALFLYWQVSVINYFPSIAYGVIAGILSYIILNGVPRLLRIISGGRIVPGNFENSEEFVVPPGSIVPFWIRKLLGRATAEEDMMVANPADNDEGKDTVSEPSASSHEKS